MWSILNDAQRTGICDDRAFIEHPAATNDDWKTFVEDNICSLIINVQPEQKLNKDLLLILTTSSPAIANTHVVGSFLLWICHLSLSFGTNVCFYKVAFSF